MERVIDVKGEAWQQRKFIPKISAIYGAQAAPA